MKDWLAKYGIAFSGLFLTGLNIYLNLQNWKKQGTNLTGTALNALVTFFLWAILVNAIITFYSRQKKLNERMRQCDLTGPLAAQIKRAGMLESLAAGRAEWLAQFLEEVWHEFDMTGTSPRFRQPKSSTQKCSARLWAEKPCISAPGSGDRDGCHECQAREPSGFV
jgi:hypothetical protein